VGGGKHLPNSKVTSIVLPLEEIGAAAVELLHQLMAGEPASIRRLPLQLVDPNKPA
jgi:DNA-binding LacI/PurR family transcriptional regulator